MSVHKSTDVVSFEGGDASRLSKKISKHITDVRQDLHVTRYSLRTMTLAFNDGKAHALVAFDKEMNS